VKTQRLKFNLTFLLIFLSLFSFSQENFEKNDKQIKASYFSVEPKIDGIVLSDPIWVEIIPIKNLTQIKPRFGELASEKTEIRVAFSDKMLFLGVICFDKEPEKIVVSDSRRDSDLNDEDSFLFIIDTYNDQQNGFLFGTNSRGMEYDAQIDNEGKGNFNTNRQQGGVIGGTNINWDASWEVKTKKGNYGWSAEFAIPLNSIRFSPGKNKIWGINFQRNISKNSETVYWSPLPLGFEIKRLSLAGKMTEINIKNSKNLKIIPYGLVQRINDKTNQTKSTNFDKGLDVKYSLTPGLTLDLTYNTDFAQVEVDDQQINIDRFNLFFPEKRSFFLENAGQFSVGSPGEIDLFFSRRIGLSNDGSIIPIIGGSRISGKIGQTNIGLLNMYTDEIISSNIDKNSFTVARINHDFSKTRSSIGGIIINKKSIRNNDNFNRVLAIDGKWGLGKKAEITGFISKSNSPDINSNDHALKIEGTYNWNGWRLIAGYTEVGEGFNPEVGYLSRNDGFKKSEFLVFKQWRPKNTGKLLEVRPHIANRTFWNFEKELITSWTHIDNHWVWESGFEIHTGINITIEGVFKDFQISDVKIEQGEYKHKEFQLVIMTNSNSKVSYKTTTFIGGYFGGNRFSSINKLNLRLGNKFNSSFSLNYNNLKLKNGTINAIITGLRFAYSFTPRIFIQSLIQYNNISNITSLNTRFGWIKNANTGLFIVLNTIRDRDFIDKIDNQIITIKYNYQFDVLGK
jgi:hypothetical protein